MVEVRGVVRDLASLRPHCTAVKPQICRRNKMSLLNGISFVSLRGSDEGAREAPTRQKHTADADRHHKRSADPAIKHGIPGPENAASAQDPSSWMAPGVLRRLEGDEKQRDSESHRHRHHRHNNHRSHREDERGGSRPPDTVGAGPGEGTLDQGPVPVRMDWMTNATGFSLTSSRDGGPADEPASGSSSRVVVRPRDDARNPSKTASAAPERGSSSWFQKAEGGGFTDDVMADIAAGRRDEVTGLPYGLFKPPQSSPSPSASKDIKLAPSIEGVSLEASGGSSQSSSWRQKVMDRKRQRLGGGPSEILLAADSAHSDAGSPMSSSSNAPLLDERGSSSSGPTDRRSSSALSGIESAYPSIRAGGRGTAASGRHTDAVPQAATHSRSGDTRDANLPRSTSTSGDTRNADDRYSSLHTDNDHHHHRHSHHHNEHQRHSHHSRGQPEQSSHHSSSAGSSRHVDSTDRRHGEKSHSRKDEQLDASAWRKPGLTSTSTRDVQSGDDVRTQSTSTSNALSAAGDTSPSVMHATASVTTISVTAVVLAPLAPPTDAMSVDSTAPSGASTATVAAAAPSRLLVPLDARFVSSSSSSGSGAALNSAGRSSISEQQSSALPEQQQQYSSATEQQPLSAGLHVMRQSAADAAAEPVEAAPPTSLSTAGHAAPTANPPPKPIEALNKLHAALLRAKMLGDAAKCAMIEKQIQAAAAPSSTGPATGSTSTSSDLAAVSLATLGPARARPSAVTSARAQPPSTVTSSSSGDTDMRVTGDESSPFVSSKSAAAAVAQSSKPESAFGDSYDHDDGEGESDRRRSQLLPGRRQTSASSSSSSSSYSPSSSSSRVDERGSSSTANTSSGGGGVDVVSTFDARGMPIRSLQSGVAAPLERDDLRTGRRKGKHAAYTNRVDVSAGTGDAASSSSAATAAVAASSASIARKSWVPDDDANSSLMDVLRRERETGAGDFDATLARNIMKGGLRASAGSSALAGAGAGSSTGADEADAGGDDDLAALAASGDARLTARAQQEKDKKRAIASHRSLGRTLESCWYCFDGASIKKYLIASLGEHSMLMLPPDGARIDGQLCIVPLPHITAMTDADEEVYDEVNKFKGAVTAMLEAEGQDALFLETAMHFGKRRHTRIDVIPMDKEEAMDAPLFFRKAIMDAEEWTSNRKLIDTSGKGLRRVIPKGFAYFHVGWKGGGFVHPIEDEDEFPPSFGIDTSAGMLGLPPGAFGRKGQRRSFEQEKQQVLEFIKRWEPFDWTRELEGGT